MAWQRPKRSREGVAGSPVSDSRSREVKGRDGPARKAQDADWKKAPKR